MAERARARDDSGAALILALVFLIVAALTLTALVSFAGTGLLDTAGFTSQRGLQYGANGAVEIAIQNVRSQPTVYKTSGNCLGKAPTTSVTIAENHLSTPYRVYCKGTSVSTAIPLSSSAAINGSIVQTSVLFTATRESVVGFGFGREGSSGVIAVISETTHLGTIRLATTAPSGYPASAFELFAPYQRLVTFYACRATTCTLVTQTGVDELTPKSVLVKAVVGFGDIASTGQYACTATPTTKQTTTCGESMVVTQWTVSSANH